MRKFVSGIVLAMTVLVTACSGTVVGVEPSFAEENSGANCLFFPTRGECESTYALGSHTNENGSTVTFMLYYNCVSGIHEVQVMSEDWARNVCANNRVAQRFFPSN